MIVCKICGDQINQLGACSECQIRKPAFSQLRSWGIYTGVLKEAIHKLKFDRGLGIMNGLLDPVLNFIHAWRIHPDLVMPVPLSAHRYRERGYNQSALIAKPIADSFNFPYSTSCIKRIRDTHTQVGLNAEERKNNIANAFEADKGICGGRLVLLVDDIATTGSTLNECAVALKRAGSAEVICFTVARAVGSAKMMSRKVI
jgi:ComF family protein